MTRKYTAFTKAFKLEDLHLASQPNTSVAQLARDLGIRRNMIYKWRVELSQKQDKAFKLEDLHLASQPNTSVAQLARDLGIRRNMIYKWRVELSQK